MEFEKLVLKNFLSYQEQEFSFDSKGLTLIEGSNKDEGDSNGSGKSSLWDAISFCLFGTTVRGLKGDEVINRKFKKDCVVCLTGSSFGSYFEVWRYRKHEEKGDRLYVVTEAGTIELGTLAQTQQWILDTFQIDFDLFRCTVLFAQGETFNFVDAGNKAQKEILSKVMKVNYDKFLSNAKSKTKALVDSINSAERELVSLEAKTEIDFEEIKERIADWEEDKKKELGDIFGRKEEVKADLEELRSKFKPMAKVLDAIKRVKFDIRAKKDALKDLEEEQAEFRSKKDWFQSDLDKANELEGQGTCPTCKAEITCLNQEWIKDSEARLEEFTKLYKDKRAEAGKMVEAIDAMAGKLEKLNNLVTEQTVIVSKIERAERDIAALESSYEAKEEEENPYLKELKNKEKIKETLDAKIEEKNIEIANYNKLMPFYNFWINAFGDSGIKSFVFDLICSNLTNKANSYLNILSGGAFSISFDTQKMTKGGELREKFDCVVIGDTGRVDYHTLSGGEKRRVSLAVDMAMSDIMSDYHGSSFNVVVFDEQSNFLDEQGKKFYLNLLKKMAKDKSVYVVDHDTEFKGYFDKSIKIEKSGGISRVV